VHDVDVDVDIVASMSPNLHPLFLGWCEYLWRWHDGRAPSWMHGEDWILVEAIPSLNRILDFGFMFLGSSTLNMPLTPSLMAFDLTLGTQWRVVWSWMTLPVVVKL
jgi:hypothetical protein